MSHTHPELNFKIYHLLLWTDNTKSKCHNLNDSPARASIWLLCHAWSTSARTIGPSFTDLLTSAGCFVCTLRWLLADLPINEGRRVIHTSFCGMLGIIAVRCGRWYKTQQTFPCRVICYRADFSNKGTTFYSCLFP